MAASSTSRVLLVEGVDDKHVIRHICERQTTPMPDFQIVEKDGVDRLLDAISVEAKVAGRTVLGIVVDANDSPNSRWQSIADRLHRADVTLPAMDRAGVVVPVEDGGGSTVRVGVWLMPDNDAQGHIEDFVVKLIPEQDPVWPLAQDYVDRIPADHRPHDVSKAELHAWLAVRTEPRRMGQAIGFGDLPIVGTVAAGFVAWLRRLFA